MINKILYLFIAFISISPYFSQKTDWDKISYQEIEEKINILNQNEEETWKMINLYLRKSKREKNVEALFYAYRNASNFSENPNNYKYADSALVVATESKNKKLIASAYINFGNLEINQNQYQKAINNLLLAKQFADESKDDYIIYKCKYLIAQNKIYLGLYEDAIAELKNCRIFFKKKVEDKSLGKDYELLYLYTLMSIIDSNSKIGKHEPNETLLKEAFKYLEKNDQKTLIPYFISSEGINAFYQKDYQKAISKLAKAHKIYNDGLIHITEIYYLGLSYWKMGRQKDAVKYFEQIDKEYNKNNKLDAEFRPTYEFLIKYNDSIKNKKKQLEYINKLMILDKSYEKDYRYLYSKIHKEYDTKELISEKNRIEKSLKYRNYIIVSLIVITLLIISFLIIRNYNLQKNYEKRFKEIISENPKENSKSIETQISDINTSENKVLSTSIVQDANYFNKIPGINPIFVENTLQQLEKFEKEENYLNPQISLKLLSENFGTNFTYVSKIINVYKGKNFNTYINDLRMDYILNLLKTDWRYLNKDIKELTAISGFLNTESFSNNFYRKFQIKPSYFIKKMKENVEMDDSEV